MANEHFTRPLEEFRDRVRRDLMEENTRLRNCNGSLQREIERIQAENATLREQLDKFAAWGNRTLAIVEQHGMADSEGGDHD